MPTLEWSEGNGYKKYKVLIVGRGVRSTVQFGDRRYEHYHDSTPLKLFSHLDHGDKERRRRYRARHRGVKLKDGTPAYKKKYSSSWFSYHYLW